MQSSVLLFLSTKFYKTWGKVVLISIYKLSKILRKDRSVKVTDKVKILESIQTVTIKWKFNYSRKFTNLKVWWIKISCKWYVLVARKFISKL